MAANFRRFVADRLGALQESDALLLGQSLTAAQECLAPRALNLSISSAGVEATSSS
jgi:hypothetical protein